MIAVMKKKPPPPDLSKLSHADKDTMILTLLERLEALEMVLYKDSHNSSKPPSSDGLAKKTVSLRESSGKPVGGQVGHKGSNLKQVAQATEVINHPLPSHCLRCQQPVPQDAGHVVERRQILDVPVTACQVIEHRALDGGPSITGYDEWLQDHKGISPVVERLGCKLDNENDGKHYLHGSFDVNAGLEFDKAHGYCQFGGASDA